jgi:hypothetical protein
MDQGNPILKSAGVKLKSFIEFELNPSFGWMIMMARQEAIHVCEFCLLWGDKEECGRDKGCAAIRTRHQFGMG